MLLAEQRRNTIAAAVTRDLAALNINPPTAVKKAHAAYQQLQQLTPAPRAAATIEAAALRLADEARSGKLKMNGLEALADEFREDVLRIIADEQSVIGRVYDRAEQQLGYEYAGAVAGWLPDAISGPMRTQFLEAAAAIDHHAPHIALDVDDSTALRSDRGLRDAWLASSDAANLMGRLSAVVATARAGGLLAVPVRDPAGAFSVARNPYALDDSRLLTSGPGWGAMRSTLPDHPLHRMLEMSRRGADWYFPTTAEQDAAAATWLDADATTKQRLAGEA